MVDVKPKILEEQCLCSSVNVPGIQHAFKLQPAVELCFGRIETSTNWATAFIVQGVDTDAESIKRKRKRKKTGMRKKHKLQLLSESGT